MNTTHPSTPGPRCICLTGFMGSGKSTVGACLADKLGWKFVDLDTEIVHSQRRAIADIFREQGETYFRDLEHDILKRVLTEFSASSVIALGGGTFVPPRNRDLLHEHGARTVYLEGDVALLLERCGAEQGTRPLAQEIEKFRALHAERQPIYQSAELTVAIGHRTPQEIAGEIASSVEKWNVQPAVSE